MKFIPTSDNILVRAVDRPDQTPSGLYIATSLQDNQVIEGKVLAAGAGRIADTGVLIPCKVKITDTVWFPKFNATKVTIDDADCYVVSERNVLGYDID